MSVYVKFIFYIKTHKGLFKSFIQIDNFMKYCHKYILCECFSFKKVMGI